MAWPTLVVPTPGTVITTAWESAMVNDPLLWLRLMTGNGDPPAAHYVVVSTGPAATAWGKVGADELAPGAAAGNIGYVPLNRAGDTMQSDLTISRASGTPSDGVLFLGNTGGGVYIGKIGGAVYITGLPVVISNGLAVPSGGLTVGGYAVWHAGNMGTGSGLVADSVRGYVPGGGVGNLPIINGNGRVPDAESVRGYVPGTGNGNLAILDGAGRVQDSQLLDGNDVTAFAGVGHTHGYVTKTGDSMSGSLAMGSGAQINFATVNGVKMDLASNGQYTLGVGTGLFEYKTAQRHVFRGVGVPQTFEVRFDTTTIYMGGPSYNWSTGVFSGDWQITGIKARIATGHDGEQGLFHANETPTPMFEEVGRDWLHDGRATVGIPRDFANYVDLADDYHVFLTPEGPAHLYVDDRTDRAFTVRRFKDEPDVGFSWRLMARQADLAHVDRKLPLAR